MRISTPAICSASPVNDSGTGAGPAAVTISLFGWFAEPKWLVEGSPA